MENANSEQLEVTPHVRFSLFAESGSSENQVNAMRALATELGLLAAFSAAEHSAVTSKKPNALLDFQALLMQTFGDQWKKENPKAYESELNKLGYQDALKNPEVEPLTAILSAAHKPIFFAYWNKINTLMNHSLSEQQITDLVVRFHEKGKTATREKIANLLHPTHTAKMS
ncbi:MAG: hypothetical protein NXI01_03210 [Gammaproteobacteria bacterium]|nr:hypothetical protein [Gammaproteobacteria bacterium]